MLIQWGRMEYFNLEFIVREEAGLVSMCVSLLVHLLIYIPQWGAAGAGIKVPFGENTELTHSPFEA